MTIDYDAVMNRLGTTKPVDQRDPFIAAGEHDLIVWAVETYRDTKWGDSVRVIFEVEKSTAHAPGSKVVRTFNLFKPSSFPTQATDADQLAKFVCVLQGIPEGSHAASCVALLKNRAQGGNAESQPARGARIHVSGQPPKGGINPQTNKPYSYVKVAWATMAQDGALIAATRAALDARSPYVPTPAFVQQQGYGQPQQMQYQQPVQPAQQVVQQPQYVQPVQPAAAPQPVTGAPAGGFLSMLPTGR